MDDFFQTSPWNMRGAFEPMYDETLSVEVSRDGKKTKTPLRVAPMTDNTADPDTGDYLDSELEAVNFVCRMDDRLFVLGLRRGDNIVWRGKKYVVQKATEDFVLGLIIKAKTA